MPASIKIEIPRDAEPLDFLASFAPAFSEREGMRAALLGVKDSFRQATPIPLDPLGMLACLTAEEEAAAFLYYALLDKGYPVPDYGKLHRHADKVKLLVLAEAMVHYFFGGRPAGLSPVVRIETDGLKPKTSGRLYLSEYVIIQDDPLETVTVFGEEQGGHDKAVGASVDKVLAAIIPNGFSAASHLKVIANRRNLCLYGDPAKKTRFQSIDDFVHFKSNSISMIVLGILVFNGREPTASMMKLVDRLYERISS